MRQLDEVRVLEHFVERGDEIGVGAIEPRTIERRMRRRLRVEIIVVIAQPLERREILVVIDRREQRAQPAEFFPLGIVGKAAARCQRVDDIALAHGDGPLGGVASGLSHGVASVAHGDGYIVRASVVKALRDCGSM